MTKPPSFVRKREFEVKALKVKKWIPFSCVGIGIILGVIRSIQFDVGYEAETQLPVPGNPLLWTIVGIFVVFAVVIALSASKMKPREYLDFVQCFRCVNIKYKTIGVICGVLLLAAGAAGVYLYIQQVNALRMKYAGVITVGASTGMQTIPNSMFWILTFVVGVSIIAILTMQSKIIVETKTGIWLVFPMLWCGFMLISCYLDYSGIPARSIYIFLAFACLFMMLAYRDFAAFLYAEKVPVARFLVTSSCAIVLAMMEGIGRGWNFFMQGNTMSLTPVSAIKIGILAIGCLFLLCNQVVLLSNLEYQGGLKPVVTQVPEEAPKEEPLKKETEASETAEEIMKEFKKEEPAEENQTKE